MAGNGVQKEGRGLGRIGEKGNRRYGWSKERFLQRSRPEWQ